MPELPEVEVTRRSFADAIALGRIESVTLGKPLRWPLGCDAQSLVGRQVLAVHRRGKYLLLQLDQGWLLVHLGMSGSLSFATALPPAGVHDHCTLVTDRGVLRLNDPRRFGAVVFVASLDDAVARKLLGGLGAEPLASDFDPVALVPLLRSRSAPIKQVLLAGDVVVGAGNIYACEALFVARVRPTRAARRLTRAEALRLLLAVQQVLARAVEAGGTTLRDFADAQGQSGHYQGEVMVYGRAGLPCHTCGTPIQLIRQGQRSSFFCPRCQPR